MPPTSTPLARPLAAAALVIALALAAAAPARAAGTRDFSYAGATQPSAPTSEKPQSKLWFNDGSWWGSLWQRRRLHDPPLRPGLGSPGSTPRRRRSTRASKSHADMLWDGAHLYALSAMIQGGARRTTPASGSTASATTPTAKTTRSTPASRSMVFTAGQLRRPRDRVLDKDSRGIAVGDLHLRERPGAAAPRRPPARPAAACASRTPPAATRPGRPPASSRVAHAASVSGNDISTIVHFGNKIGVLFSRPDPRPEPATTPADYFAVHVDGAARHAWTRETALVGTDGRRPPQPQGGARRPRLRRGQDVAQRRRRAGRRAIR